MDVVTQFLLDSHCTVFPELKIFGLLPGLLQCYTDDEEKVTLSSAKTMQNLCWIYMGVNYVFKMVDFYFILVVQRS